MIPHAVIERSGDRGLAVGARSGYIYIRGEYRLPSPSSCRRRSATAYAKGFLGENIFGSGP